MDLPCTDRLTVHNLNFLRPSAAAPSSALLHAGREFIKQAVGTPGWYPVRPASDASTFDIGDNTFVFSLNIPGIQSQKATCVELRAWEHEPSPAEDCWFELEHLEDFESTILEHFPSVRCISPDARTEAAATDYHLHSVVPRNDISDGPVHEPERKRRRLDTSSLYTAIPQPHYHSPPHNDVRLPGCSIPPYRKVCPVPVPPHTLSTAQEYLNAPFARAAWIIPIRGILSVAGASSASLLECSQELMLPTPPTTVGGEITWTRLCLTSFWAFLLVLRSSGSLGPISLSFHAAEPSPGGWQDAEIPRPIPANTPDEPACRSDSDSLLPPLVAVDHLKLYHDAEYTMSVRNALDAWGYQTDVAAGAQELLEDNTAENAAKSAKSRKIRVLKGARLLLVDNVSKGLLIS